MEEKRKTNWAPRKRSHSKHTGRMQSRLREMPEAAVKWVLTWKCKQEVQLKQEGP